MNDRQVRDEIFTIFLAGYESTASGATWALHLLSRHPEVMTRRRAELERVLGGRLPAYPDLASLTYTRMVVNETFRLYPAFQSRAVRRPGTERLLSLRQGPADVHRGAHGTHDRPAPDLAPEPNPDAIIPVERIRDACCPGGAAAGRGRALTVVLWLVQVGLALPFLAAAIPKLVGAPTAVAMFAVIGVGQWFRYAVGAAELAGAMGLLVPRLAGLAALGRVLDMIGAAAVQTAVFHAYQWLPTSVLLVGALVAWGRRQETRALAPTLVRKTMRSWGPIPPPPRAGVPLARR
jgi:putative oxidoreductase